MYSRVLFLEAQKHGYGLDIWTSPGCRIYFETFLDKENPVDCFSKNTNLRKYLRDSTYDKIVVAEAIYSDSNLELMKSALKELLKSANEVYLFKESPPSCITTLFSPTSGTKIEYQESASGAAQSYIFIRRGSRNRLDRPKQCSLWKYLLLPISRRKMALL
jgi:hypothetical protein